MKMKKILLVILPLSIVLSFVSCDQRGLGFGSLVENILAAPSEAMKSDRDYIAGNTWSAMQERTEEARALRGSGSGSGSECVVRIPPTATAAASTLASTLTAVRDSFCTCKAWGTCSQDNCTCNQLCPDTFDILDRGGQENVTSAANTFEFRNWGTDFNREGVSHMTGGFCWGIAALEQRFNRLAFFDPTVPKPFPSDPTRRLEAYEEIIWGIRHNEVREIPGFPNLREFSKDAEVQDLLQNASAEMWGEYAVGTQGTGIILSSTPIVNPATQALIADLEYRIQNHQAPNIVFNKKDCSASCAHVVQVYDVRTHASGAKYFCIRDSNFPGEDQTDCQSKMTVYADPDPGHIYYNRLGDNARLGQVEITHNENSDTVAQINSLRNKCERDKNCNASVRRLPARRPPEPRSNIPI